MAENLYDVVQSFRQALLQRERDAAVRLIQAYGIAYERLSTQLDKLLKQIETARASGETVDQAWLLRQQRYFTLLNLVVREISRYADLAGNVITDGQRHAVRQATQDAQRLLLSAMEQAPEGLSAEFNRINPAAVENLVGFMGDGSPLKSVLDRHGALAANVIREELTNAVIQGRNPKETARQIRKRLYKDGEVPSGQLRSFLNTSRTETLRAYREASHQTYQQNADILEGWIWLSALNARTCRACIALHGTFHELGERMKSHVNCRCTQVPAIRGVDLGIEKGTDWFAKQPAAVQKAVLDGEGEYESYKAGKVRLEDFTGLRRSVQWGDSYQALGLKRALAGEGEFPGRAAPVARPPEEIPPVLPPAVAPLQIRPILTAQREVPGISSDVLALIEYAELDEERLSVERLGLSHKPFNFPRGRIREREIEVTADQLSLGRDVLTKDRLLRLERDLAGGVERQSAFNIQVVHDPAAPGRYIVSGDGNHRVAYLQLVAYEGKFTVLLQESARRSGRPTVKKAKTKAKVKETLGPLEAYARSSPQNVTVEISRYAQELFHQYVGRNATNQELAWAVGALDDARVTVYDLMSGDLFITIEHPDIKKQERYLKVERGQFVIDNSYFVKRPGAPRGIGAKSFARQVVGAQRIGAKKIKTLAGGALGEDMNGYYTWPRLGYNAPLSEYVQQLLPPTLKSKDLHELFSKPGGPEWWMINGVQQSMEFDLRPGGEHERRLFEYLRDRDRKEGGNNKRGN